MKRLKVALVLMSTGFFLASATGGLAGSGDAIINKLVEKGVLTQEEALQLQNEAEKENEALAKEFYNSNPVKVGGWVDKLTVGGDLRLRYERNIGRQGSDPDEGVDNVRNRFRYRLRLNADWALKDNLRAGIQLATESEENSSNRSMNDFFAADGIFIRKAFMEWTPNDWLAVGGGKFEWPMWVSPLWDADVNPEGAYQKYKYEINDQFSLFGTTSQWILDAENSSIAAGGENESVVGFIQQGGVRWDINKDRKSYARAAGGYYHLDGNLQQTAAGGGRPPAASAAAGTSFRIVDGIVEYGMNVTKNLPIKFYGEYAHNLDPSANGGDELEEISTWIAGLQLGSAKKKNTWQLGYAFVNLGQNAIPGRWTDSDFGFGNANGYGHVVEGRYAFTDSFTLGAKYFRFDMDQSRTEQQHRDTLQVDASLAF